MAPEHVGFAGRARELERLEELTALPTEVLRAVVPAVQPFVAGEAVATVGPGAQARLFDGVARLLRRLADPAPVLVVVEDLHWAHPTTLALFCVLSQRLAGQRVTLVGTERQPGPALARHLALLLTETSRGDHVDRLHLVGLSEDEVARQLGALVGEEPPRAVVRSVLARSEGNPLEAEGGLVGAVGHASHRARRGTVGAIGTFPYGRTGTWLGGRIR